MRICAISDTHGKFNQLDLSQYPADVLVHAGDWTTRDSKTEIINFLQWFSLQDYKYLILIAGNHEKFVETNQEWFYGILKTFPNITYLQDSGITLDGIKFYGSPHSNKFYNWAFMKEENELQKIWNKIPDDTNVLITHGPSYGGSQDLVKHAYGRDPHVGSQSLHYKKLSLQGTLKAHISGHIHEGYSTTVNNGCTSICASVLNEKYKLTNDPIILEV